MYKCALTVFRTKDIINNSSKQVKYLYRQKQLTLSNNSNKLCKKQGGLHMAKDIIQKADDFEKKIAQLKAKKAAFLAKEKEAFKKIDTRKKILVGAYFVEQYKDRMPELSKLLDPFLVRDDDRKLFDLPIKEKPVVKKTE
jgi:hypothetical protein